MFVYSDEKKTTENNELILHVEKIDSRTNKKKLERTNKEKSKRLKFKEKQKKQQTILKPHSS